jgi:hypothetical protein
VSMMNLLYEPWPWYIAGPLIGLMVPLLLLAARRRLFRMNRDCSSVQSAKASARAGC